jgi:hypothetical protein
MCEIKQQIPVCWVCEWVQLPVLFVSPCIVRANGWKSCSFGHTCLLCNAETLEWGAFVL